MRARFPLVLGACASLVLACGGASPAPASPAEAPHEHEHGPAEVRGHTGAEHEEHGALPATVKDLHDTFAPIWHMPKGPERDAKTCSSALVFHDKSVAIQSAPAPERAKAADWKNAAGELTVASTALVTECEKEGRPALGDRFSAFHERFHKLVEQLEHP